MPRVPWQQRRYIAWSTISDWKNLMHAEWSCMSCARTAGMHVPNGPAFVATSCRVLHCDYSNVHMMLCTCRLSSYTHAFEPHRTFSIIPEHTDVQTGPSTEPPAPCPRHLGAAHLAASSALSADTCAASCEVTQPGTMPAAWLIITQTYDRSGA